MSANQWTKSTSSASNNNNNNYENAREKASSENDLNDSRQPKTNGDLKRQSVSSDNIALRYRQPEGATPKPIIKMHNMHSEYSDSVPTSLNSNSVRFSMETLDEESPCDVDHNHAGLDNPTSMSLDNPGSMSSEQMIESLQCQVRTLENDVREFKDSLNGKIANIMEILQDIRNQNLNSGSQQQLAPDEGLCEECGSLDGVYRMGEEGCLDDHETAHSYIDIDDDDEDEVEDVDGGCHDGGSKRV